MTKLEVIYEKLAAEARDESEDVLMMELLKRVHMLELDRKTSVSDRDEDYAEFLKTDIADVMFYLVKVASKHGACMECLADIMETKRKFLESKREGFTIIVPTPKVTNTDNTGPAIK